jgi:hypothetical protein
MFTAVTAFAKNARGHCELAQRLGALAREQYHDRAAAALGWQRTVSSLSSFRIGCAECDRSGSTLPTCFRTDPVCFNPTLDQAMQISTSKFAKLLKHWEFKQRAQSTSH